MQYLVSFPGFAGRESWLLVEVLWLLVFCVYYYYGVAFTGQTHLLNSDKNVWHNFVNAMLGLDIEH